MNGSKLLGIYNDESKVATYVRATRAGKPLLIAWAKTGRKSMKIQLKGNSRLVSAKDIFGKSSLLPIKNNTIVLTLTESPLYIEGLKTMDSISFATEKSAKR